MRLQTVHPLTTIMYSSFNELISVYTSYITLSAISFPFSAKSDIASPRLYFRFHFPPSARLPVSRCLSFLHCGQLSSLLHLCLCNGKVNKFFSGVLFNQFKLSSNTRLEKRKTVGKFRSPVSCNFALYGYELH